jgi:hypothetical protein
MHPELFCGARVGHVFGRTGRLDVGLSIVISETSSAPSLTKVAILILNGMNTILIRDADIIEQSWTVPDLRGGGAS